MSQLVSVYVGDVVPEWVGQRARLTPDRIAVVASGHYRTFGDLDRDVEGLANTFLNEGMRAGDRVAMLLGNGYPAVVAIHALIRVGAVLVPLNARLTSADLAWQISASDCRLVIHDERFEDLARQIGATVIVVRLRELTDVASGELPHRTNPIDRAGQSGQRVALSAIQSIMYTSGTTGRPKGAMISLGNLWWSAIGSAINLGNQVSDRWLVCMPVYHIGGLSILVRSVIYGIPAIIHPTFDAEAVNRSIDDDDVTIVSVVSTMLQRMLDVRGERPYPRALRCVLLGGGPAPAELLARCVARGIPVVQTYGLTETASQVATLPPEEALRKLGSAGKPLFPTELQIDIGGSIAPPGTIGEIVVRGPTVTSGYQDQPDATAFALRDGWLHTGDLGYLDGEGFLYVVDRRDDLVVTGGENVYPAEVESVLRQHPAVAEAIIVGLPDPTWGQRVGVAIVLRSGAKVSSEEIVEYCRSRLAGYKVPSRFWFVSDIPRNSTGKVLRRILRDSWPAEVVRP